MDLYDSTLKAWYARRPFGKRTLEASVQLQIRLRAFEEGLSIEGFEAELARRNGSSNAYLLGNQAYSARPSRWLPKPQ
ncbi:hypothetical protein FJZ22_03490 [Candidatus Pacearchaeota archaeon]|nr:hypothetical protein [Candidatus Pacearchaeota archaeon]